MGSKNSAAGMTEFLRWLLLPFASVVGASVGAEVVTLFQVLTMSLSKESLYYLYALPVVSSAVFGWLFVLITFKVAPKAKIKTAVIMTIILASISVIGILFFWSRSPNAIELLIQSSMGFSAAMIAAIKSIFNYKDGYVD